MRFATQLSPNSKEKGQPYIRQFQAPVLSLFISQSTQNNIIPYFFANFLFIDASPLPSVGH